jgi:hypothetical protein
MVGSARADWSTTSGRHVMTVVEAVTHLPVVKPQVVCFQIHNAQDDLIMGRVSGKPSGNLLEVTYGGTNFGNLDTNYQLGTKFTVRIVAENGIIEVYYNDMTTPKLKIPAKSTGCYWKLGLYVQSNISKGDKPGAYGENWVYSAKVEHS